MDPAIASISSVVGLLATFLQERRHERDTESQATIQEYIEWLRRREHTESITLLKENGDLTAAVQQQLSAGHTELIERLSGIEQLFSMILGPSAVWGPLVRSIHPSAGLSDQAIRFLRWFDDTGSDWVFVVGSRSDPLTVLPEAAQAVFLVAIPASLIWLLRTTINHARSFEDLLRRIEHVEGTLNRLAGDDLVGFQSSHPSRLKAVGGRTGAETVVAVLMVAFILIGACAATT